MITNQKRTILTIEDTATFRILIRLTLEFEGFHVLEANDGPTGLGMASASMPDLILLDLMMPGMDGKQVCQQLKANPRLQSIPIVLLSSSDDSDDIEAGLQLGAQGSLMKPFQPKMLVDMVRQQLHAAAAPPPAR